MRPLKLLEYIRSTEDDEFDLIYPIEVRKNSGIHWTPVAVAESAAEFLVQEPGTRVLDVGCGPGKFCIVGARSTPGVFIGIEQRKYLCEIGQAAIEQADLTNARLIHGNATDVVFANFDAFYIFNPFEENLDEAVKIDGLVDLSNTLYDRYIRHVAMQLAAAPLGTRVATYCGPCQEVPLGYECQASSPKHGLRFWEKTKHHPFPMEREDLSDEVGYRSLTLEPA